MSQEPHDEAATGPGDNVQHDGQHDVEEVLRPIAEGHGVQRYARKTTITLLDGEVVEALELIESGEESVLWKPSEPYSMQRFVEVRSAVKWLYEFKYSLLHSVEAYKALLVCHLFLLLFMIAVIIAMARA